MSIKLSSLLFFLLFSVTASFGQNFYKERIPRVYSLQFSAGPAIMYSDNGGHYRGLDFPVYPSFELSGMKKINRRIDLRATVGYQHVSSSMEYEADKAYQWGEQLYAYAFQGDAFFFDITPQFNFMTYETHIERSRINGYAGVGIGFIAIPSEQAYALPNTTRATIIKTTPSSIYIPIRLGGTVAFGSNWDIGFEASLLATLSDELDGNVGYNQTNDMLFQGQLFVKRYLSPFPFWEKWSAK